jgi:hypothetical protein
MIQYPDPAVHLDQISKRRPAEQMGQHLFTFPQQLADFVTNQNSEKKPEHEFENV